MTTSARSSVPPEMRTDSDLSWRWLPALLVLLAIVLLVVGATSAWAFKRMNEKYSQLVSQTTTDLEIVQNIALHSSLGYARVMELPAVHDHESRTELIQMIAEQRVANDKLFGQLDKSVASPEVIACLRDVESKRLVCRKEYADFLGATERGKPLDIQSPEWRQMLSAFVAYQSACEELASQLAERSIRASNQSTREVRRLQIFFFMLGILPLGLALVLILLIVCLICATPVEMELRDSSNESHQGRGNSREIVFPADLGPRAVSNE